jgi:hypothetical protein
MVKKVQWHLFNLKKLKKFGLAPKTLTNFYRCTIESIQAVSPPGTATALITTAGLSSGWCGLPNASPEAHCLPSRTSTAPSVKESSSSPSTSRATAYSHHYHPEGEVSTGLSKLRPRD